MQGDVRATQQAGSPCFCSLASIVVVVMPIAVWAPEADIQLRSHGHAVLAQGMCDAIPGAMKDDGTWARVYEGPGCNGTPPMVYGIAWNPLRPQVRSSSDGHSFSTWLAQHHGFLTRGTGC